MRSLYYPHNEHLENLAYAGENLEAKEGDLRVWWIPQVPGDPFYQRVADVNQAILLLKALAAYDAFQIVNNIRPDYSNAGGLEVFKDGEWVQWCHPDIFDDIDEYMRNSQEETTSVGEWLANVSDKINNLTEDERKKLGIDD